MPQYCRYKVSGGNVTMNRIYPDSIEFDCPSCGSVLLAEFKGSFGFGHADQQLRCPACRARFWKAIPFGRVVGVIAVGH